MKKNLIILLVAVLALGAFNADAQNRSRKRAKTTKTTKKASAVSTKPIITDKTKQENGMKLIYQHIEVPAFYKVPKADADFSNGYCDASISIDWPVSLNDRDVPEVQNILLTALQPNASKLEDVYKPLTVCTYSKRATRVAKMPSNSDDEALREKLDVSVYRLTPYLLGFAWLTDIYTGSGTSAGVLYQTDYMNIDLVNNRVLTTDMCFKPGTENVIANELKKDDETWDMLWDEYKDNPAMPSNFKISDDDITFYFPKYEIAPGSAGVVEVELSMDKIKPYALPPLLAVLKKDNEPVIGIPNHDGPILESAEQMPQYPGGTYQLTQDISQTIRYPEKAIRANANGKVVVRFVVTRTGDVGDVVIVQSVNEELDHEAMRVVRSLPHKFTPGMVNGEPVNVWYTLPIIFKLN